MIFTRKNLEDDGFTGWLPFADIRSSACPTSGGVYVVIQDAKSPVKFAERSCGGWFKGQDSSVPSGALNANWVDGAEVVYIGKTNQLRRPLTQYANFGVGKPFGIGADA